MHDPRYEAESSYDEYDYYPEEAVTSVGLPPSQLALLIGVNAVISLIISVVVVLIATRQAIPGLTGAAVESTPGPDTVAVSVGETAETTSIDGQAFEAGSEGAVAIVPTPATPLQNVTYEVKVGDTLTGIADQFNVSLFDLMTINGLTNQDFIQVGQSLIIPIGGLPTVTATFTPAPIPTETPLPFDPPTPLPSDAEVPREPAATVGPSPTPIVTPTGAPTEEAAAAVLSTPGSPQSVDIAVSQVTGAGDLARETVIILNQGAGVSLLNWRLEGSSLATFTFPDIFLFSGGSIRLHTASGQNTPSDIYLNQEQAAWPPGTTLTLRNAEGTPVVTYTVPPS